MTIPLVDGTEVGRDPRGMLRIIAGEYRSRQLLAPSDANVSRPYAHRVKESVFNLLRGWFEDANVLDLFAGVGTIGLETISRGAARVVMVERDRTIHKLLQQNVERLGCSDRATVVLGDALAPAAILRAPAPVDLLFVDPPYPMMENEADRARVLEQIVRCREVLAPKSFVILRSPRGPEKMPLEIEGFDGPEAHRYGPTMWVLLYAPSGESV